MNKLFSTFYFLLAIPLFAQQIKPGVYVSQGIPEDIMINLSEDGKFQIMVYDGKYKLQNDRIQLESERKAERNFSISKVADSDVSEKELKISFDASFSYLLDYIYIGFDSEDNLVPIQSLANMEELDSIGNQSLVVTHPDYLYLLYYDTMSVPYINKYAIPIDVHEIKVGWSYDYYKLDDLTIELNPENNHSFKIYEGQGTNEVNFVHKDNVQTDSENVRIFSESSVPKNNFVPKVQEIDAVETVNYTSETSTYKINRFSSWNDALNSLKDKEDRYAVIVYDLENSEAQKQFDEFMNNRESELSYYSENQFLEIFEFYEAEKKDENIFKKNGIKKFPAFMIFNKDGEMLYHTSGNIQENNDLFYLYGELNKKIKGTQAKYDLDKIAADKKVDFNELKTALKNAMLINGAATYDYAQSEKIDATVQDYYNPSIKDEENLYKLKLSQDKLNTLWEKLLDRHAGNDEPDEDLIELIKREFNNDGISAKLYNNYSSAIRPMDKKGLAYLMRFEEQIQFRDKQAYDNYESDYYSNNIDTVVNTWFSNILRNKSSFSDDTLVYLIEILKENDFPFNWTNEILYNLEMADQKNERYFNLFKSYYDANFPENLNVFESLNRQYERSSNDYKDWSSFKSSIANTLNNVAWYSVTDAKDSNLFSDAVKWSETSNVMVENNPYYLDTLAQLYYKSGKKSKALELQRKAFTYISQDMDPEIYEDIKNVLEKMENGTYE